MPMAVRRRRRWLRVPPPIVPIARNDRLDRVSPLALVVLALLASAMVHVVLAVSAGHLHLRPPARKWTPRESIRVAVVEEQPPPPPPPSVPVPAPVAPPVRAHVPRATPHPAARPLPTPPAPVPAPAPAPPTPTTAPTTAEPPLLMPGMSLSATSAAGGVAVRPGAAPGGGPGTGQAGGGAEAHAGVGPIVPGYALTEEPVFLDNVSSAEMRRLYPEDARRDKVEGPVRLKLLVDDQGAVRKATVIEDPTGAFRAAAIKVARLYRFRPARVNGQAVATQIEFTIHFELD